MDCNGNNMKWDLPRHCKFLIVNKLEKEDGLQWQ